MDQDLGVSLVGDLPQKRGHMAVGQNQRYHFGVGTPPFSFILVVGLGPIHWSCDLDFDPWPCTSPNRYQETTRLSGMSRLEPPGGQGSLWISRIFAGKHVLDWFSLTSAEKNRRTWQPGSRNR